MATAEITNVPDVQSPRMQRPDWQIPWNLLPLVVFTLSLMAAAGLMVFAPNMARIAVLIPAVVVLGLVMIVRPELALILSVAYTPFESSQFQPFALPGGLTISKLLGFALLGVFIFNVLFRKRRFRMFDDSQDFAIALFAASMLFSGAVSVFPDKTMESAERMLRMLAFYFAVKNLISSFTVVRLVMWAMTLSVTAATIFGINEFIVEGQQRIHDIRVRGVYMDVNDYAALTVFAVLVSIHLFEMVRSYPKKALIAVCLGLMLCGIVLSGSRGGLLALAVGIAFYIWRHPQRKLMAFVCVSSVVITFPFWPEGVRTRLLGDDQEAISESLYTRNVENSTARRGSYVTFGLDIIAENPVLGTGYGTFSQLYPRSRFSTLEDNPMTDFERYRLAHNAYLEITFGMGFIGLAFYLAIWGVSLLALERAGRGARRGSSLWAAANGFQLGLVSLMVASFFLSIEHFNYTWIGVAMSSALMAYVRQRDATALIPASTKGT